MSALTVPRVERDVGKSSRRDQQFAETLVKHIGPARCRVWLRDASVVLRPNGRLLIVVPDTLHREQISARFAGEIRSAVEERFGPDYPFEYVVERADLEGYPIRSCLEKIKTDSPKPPPKKPDAPMPLIAGTSNEEAVDAARGVAEGRPDCTTVFFCGPSGVGKTHLVQVMCRAFENQYPGEAVRCMTGESFSSEVTRAVRHGELAVFRARVAAAKLVVIDDCLLLNGSIEVQQEMANILACLAVANHRVVLVSDRHPKHIKGLCDSLRARFGCMRIVEMSPPDLTMRRKILEMWSERAKLQLSEDVVDWVARYVPLDVRKLRGAFNRVEVAAKDSCSLDLDSVKRILSDVNEQSVRFLTPEEILDAVFTCIGVSKEEVVSGLRLHRVTLARCTAAFLLRSLTHLSYPEIAERLGAVSHSTAISACKAAQSLLGRGEVVRWKTEEGNRTEVFSDLLQRIEDRL